MSLVTAGLVLHQTLLGQEPSTLVVAAVESSETLLELAGLAGVVLGQLAVMALPDKQTLAAAAGVLLQPVLEVLAAPVS